MEPLKISMKANAHVKLAEQICNAVVNQGVALAAKEDGVDLKTHAYNPESMEWTPRPTPPKE